MSKRIILICGILLVAAGLAVGFQLFKPPPESKPLGNTALLVDVRVLEAGSYSFDVESQGTVRPLTETTLSAEVAGPIVSVSPKLVAGGVFEAGNLRSAQGICRCLGQFRGLDGQLDGGRGERGSGGHSTDIQPDAGWRGTTIESLHRFILRRNKNMPFRSKSVTIEWMQLISGILVVVLE